MWIRRIAVEHWRGLDALVLDDLSPGLNLVAGPNESGKSRLVQALRFALFESTKGKAGHKKDLASWGVAPEKPRVSVEFEFAGQPWTVEKAFLGTGTNTALRGPAGTLEGEAAEARLAQLLGVGEAGAREFKDDDAGIWPLLWVNQGQSWLDPTAATNADAQRRIQDTLTDEVGEVTAGERGQRLLARARAQYERFYTSGRGAERGPLTEARERVAGLEQQLAAARAARDAVAADAEALARLRARAADLDERCREAAERLEAARAGQAAAQAAGEQLRAQVQRTEAAAAALARERDAARGREALAKAIAERSGHVDTLAEELAAAEAARDAQAGEQAALAAAATRAGEAAEAAAREFTALRRRDEQARAFTSLAGLVTRVERARALNAALREQREARARLPDISAATLADLRALGDTVREAAARLEGASAGLRIQALRDLQIDGQPLAGGAEARFSVDEERGFELDGIARIIVSPGGGELPRLRDALRQARAALAAELERLGVEDVAAAERVADERRAMDERVRAAESELAREAPEGLEALELQCRELRARLGAPDAESDTNPAADSGTDPGSVDAAALRAAEAAEQAARQAFAAAAARRDAVVGRVMESRTAVASLQARLESARTELAAQTGQLAALPDVATLADTLSRLEQDWQEQLGLRAAVQARFDELGGENRGLELEQAEKAHAALQAQARSAGEEILVLQERLRSAGDSARHERVQDLEAGLEAACTALARIEAQAGAAKRLFEVLDAAARETRERLARPVIARIQPYLADLFPGSEVALDEDLRLKGLRGSAAEEEFAALSGGAREQLALLVRIGLAEVLGSEEPWPLVLDDALVNTDPARIRRVQRLLYQASRRMQILLFTCHGALFDALGPDRHIELPDRPR